MSDRTGSASASARLPAHTWFDVRRGSSHVRTGLPCQDAAAVWRGRLPQGQVTILVVADGHGDSKYDLSEHGARLAVQTALHCLRSFCRRFNTSSSLLYDAIRHDFAHRLTRQWRQAVLRHYSENFPQDVELLNRPSINLYRRYGTTLLFSLAFDDCLIGGQIGDGDMTVTHTGGDVGRPIPVAERLIANETHSLISADSIRLWRFCRWTLHEPCLICLSTDGLSNGMASDESFGDFLRSLVRNIEQYSFAETVKVIPGFLDRVSAGGSGDDVSLALFWQADPRRKKKK
jgi:serine/threonine protein phosphatase PrpC